MPVEGNPIENGFVRLDRKGTILEIGGGNGGGRGETFDHGDVAIAPAGVNAHCHTEFSGGPSPVAPPGTPLHRWVLAAIAARSTVDIGDSRSLGWERIAATATAAAADVVSVGPHSPPSDATRISHQPDGTGGGLYRIELHEVIGLAGDRWRPIFSAAGAAAGRDPRSGVSPHAPYSTSLDAIRAAVAWSRDRRRTLAMHVAEDPAERGLLFDGGGPFARTLVELGIAPESFFPWASDRGTTHDGPDYRDLLRTLASGHRTLIIHGNDLEPGEVDVLVGHHSATVVYCPRTHAYFGYRRHPVAEMRRRGVRVALGTDSLASNPDLDVWGEAAHLLRRRVDLSPREVLRMATVDGADALGLPGRGRLTVGSRPGLACWATRAGRPDAAIEDLAGDSEARGVAGRVRRIAS